MYLGNVLYECDDQLDVGEHIEKVQPGELATDRDKEGDEHCQPEKSHDNPGHIGHALLASLRGERERERERERDTLQTV